MPSSRSTGPIGLTDLQRLYPLLDQLQVGFLLVDGSGAVRHATYWARRLFDRRALRLSGMALLGQEAFDSLVEPILAGRSSGGRWREMTLEAGAGATLAVMVRSMAVTGDDGEIVALLAFQDVSDAVDLHEQYKRLLERQKQINEQLRAEIARQLRAHEDDVSQFSELLQVAPTIFASFVAEATETVGQLERLARNDRGNVAAARRAMHTLKGNARSLGLNFIGGRAHGVEEVLARIDTDRAREAETLAELIQDLRRALDRAAILRARLAPEGAGPTATLDLEHYVELDGAAATLREALARLPADHPARPSLEGTLTTLEARSRIPLQQLFEYLRATVSSAARGAQIDCPSVETSGGAIAVPPDVYRALSTSLPHLVRNAVAHGIEPAPERLEAGKPATGTVSLAATATAGGLLVKVRDDGRGLPLDRLRQQARARGEAIPETAAELAALVLAPGVSTADEVTLDKGRGLGTTAAKEALDAIGAALDLRSEPGGGVEFAISIPLAHGGGPPP